MADWFGLAETNQANRLAQPKRCKTHAMILPITTSRVFVHVSASILSLGQNGKAEMDIYIHDKELKTEPVRI